jgi:phosphohistidine phosphatase
MKLYLVQHAKATSKDVDRQRGLTEQGQRDIQKMAAFIRTLKLSVDDVWHSGKKRAAQTAELLAQVIAVSGKVAARDGLGPTEDVTPIKGELASAEQDIMIVGHLPFLGKLASLLVTGSEQAGAVAFKKGGIVCLSRSEENGWQLEWMVVPDLLTD